jgi:toxin HigB-1
MIVGSRNGWLRAFFVDGVPSRNIPSDLESRLFRKLQMIDDATGDQDSRVPPSNHSEKLRGNLDGFHSIRVNKQWRLIFRWDGRNSASARKAIRLKGKHRRSGVVERSLSAGGTGPSASPHSARPTGRSASRGRSGRPTGPR